MLNIPITSIKFDEVTNDFVYLIYDQETTNDKITFNHVFYLNAVDANTQVSLSGFIENVAERIISMNCFTTGFQKDFPATKMDPGYQGFFENTTCRSWYGVSGGPVFSLDPITNKTIIYGIVTHTFDTLESGEPNFSLIKNDQFGESLTTMYSPFNLSMSLQSYLI